MGIVIVVAHRPESAIAGVDRLLMMNQGKAQAIGPKDEVLSKACNGRLPYRGRSKSCLRWECGRMTMSQRMTGPGRPH
jgi:ABC-type protease/lipase transport system fused ATPase/permease subunit